MGICESSSNSSQISNKNKNQNPTSSSQRQRQDTLMLNNDIIVSSSGGNIDDIYEKQKLLGEGSYGKVWLVKHKMLQKLFALKIIKRKNDIYFNNKVQKEIQILKKLDHPFILKIIEFHSTNTEYHIITDFCQNGELYTEITHKGTFTEREASFILYQILLAIRYCHKMGIVHRDIKPENIMIEKKEPNGLLRVKLIDFGVAKIFSLNVNHKTMAGSSIYMAPEVLRANYNESCDLWSIGVILYILLIGQPPFFGKNENEIFQAIKSGKYDISNKQYLSLSQNAKDLISKLLKYNPQERITAFEALNHPWFNTADIININYLPNEKIIQLLLNLDKYKSYNIIKCAILAYLVHINSDIKEYIEAGKLFNSLDIDHDGKLDKNELINGFMKYLNLSQSDSTKKVNDIFINIDSDKNGLISSEEFIRGCISPDIFYSTNYLKVAFDLFDKNRDGNVSINEMEEIFGQNSELGSKAKMELQNLFNQIDVNKDGFISFDEFSSVIKGIIAN